MNFIDEINILIVDSASDKRACFANMLNDIPLRINYNFCYDVNQAAKFIREKPVDICFIRLSDDPADTGCVFNLLTALDETLPFILLCNTSQLQPAMELLKSNAHDFIFDHEVTTDQLHKTVFCAVKYRKTAKELRQINERYALVSKATNDMIWDWDLLNNHVFRSSEGWEKVFGSQAAGESILPDSWWDRVHPDDREKSNAIIENILHDPSKLYFEIECRILNNDGSYGHVIDRGYVMRNERGDVIRLIGATQNITEKKVAEENLEKLSLIARESINAVVVTDETGIVNWVNRSFHTITGYEENETVGKPLPKLLRALGSDEISVRYIRRQMYRQSAFEADVLIYTKLGKKKWLQIHCQPQTTASNKSFFAVITDISRDKETEILLKASEKRFRSIIEKSSEGITLTDRTGHVIEMSPAGKLILGYNKDEPYENVGINIIHPEDAEAIQHVFSEVQAAPGRVLNTQYRFQRPDGNYIWLESVFHNLLSEPEINAVVIHFRDITERKYFEEVLKNSEANYRNLFNNNPSSIFIWDPQDLSIIEVNDAAIKEYGYTKKEFREAGMRSLLQPDDIKVLHSYGSKLSAGEIKYFSYTVPHILKSYTLQLMEVSCSPIDYFGKKAALAIVNNVTEKASLEMRLAEERKQRQNEITQAVITAQEQERSGLGKELHDNINQILATTKLYIEHALENRSRTDELLHAARGFIETAVGEIRMLTKSLAPPSLGELGLFSALDELIKTIEPVNSFYIRSFWLLQTDNDIPASLRLTIFRIVQEQFTNISKHASAKNVEIMIFAEAGSIKVKITDDGKGFDLHAKRSGVGLKNIYSRANLHNGTVDLQSGDGKGCILEITFKMAV